MKGGIKAREEINIVKEERNQVKRSKELSRKKRGIKAREEINYGERR